MNSSETFSLNRDPLHVIPLDAIDPISQRVNIHVFLKIQHQGIVTIPLELPLSELRQALTRRRKPVTARTLHWWLLRRAWIQVVTSSPAFSRAVLLDGGIFWRSWESDEALPFLP